MPSWSLDGTFLDAYTCYDDPDKAFFPTLGGCGLFFFSFFFAISSSFDFGNTGAKATSTALTCFFFLSSGVFWTRCL